MPSARANAEGNSRSHVSSPNIVTVRPAATARAITLSSRISGAFRFAATSRYPGSDLPRPPQPAARQRHRGPARQGSSTR